MTQMPFQELNLKQFRTDFEMNCVSHIHALNSEALWLWRH